MIFSYLVLLILVIFFFHKNLTLYPFVTKNYTTFHTSLIKSFVGPPVPLVIFEIVTIFKNFITLRIVNQFFIISAYSEYVINYFSF